MKSKRLEADSERPTAEAESRSERLIVIGAYTCLAFIGMGFASPWSTYAERLTIASCLAVAACVGVINSQAPTWAKYLPFATVALALFPVTTIVAPVCALALLVVCHRDRFVTPAAGILSASVLATAEIYLASGRGWPTTIQASHRLAKVFPAFHGEVLGPWDTGLGLFAATGVFLLAFIFLSRGRISMTLLLVASAATLGALALVEREPTILAALPFFTALADRPIPARVQSARIVAATATLGLVLLVSWTLLFPIKSSGSNVRTVAFLTGGLKTMRAPSATTMDNIMDARFGELVSATQSAGFEVKTIAPSFLPADLQGVSLLYVINPTETPTADQVKMVEDFVKAGGAMILLTDHTDIGGIMRASNAFLGFTEIRSRYNSAIDQHGDSDWIGSLASAWTPGFALRSNSDYGIHIGCSLSVGPDALAIVVSKGGFSDTGNPLYGESHLGNMQYDKGEEHGGLILAAQQYVGHGVVQAWGDTSGFQDSAFASNYRFIAGNLDQLLGKRLYVPQGGPPTYLLAAACAFCLLLAWQRPLVSLLLPLAALPVLATMASWSARDIAPISDLNQCAFFDWSSGPMYPNIQRPDYTGRLAECFQREGILVVGHHSLSDLGKWKPSWLVLDGPSREISEAEAKVIRSYVEDGGKLLLLANYRSISSLQELETALEFHISPVKVGAAHNSRVDDIQLRKELGLSVTPAPSLTQVAYDAEVTMGESNAILGTDYNTIVSCWGYPLIVERHFGHGKVTIIGDDRYATTKNLGELQINPIENKLLASLIGK